MPAIINTFNGNYIEHIDTLNQSYYTATQTQDLRPHTQDVQPIDTSFFCTKLFAPGIIEKNIRQAIDMASSKADACRRLMALETQGYVLLSNVPDEKKAELINPFAAPKFTLTGEDFKKARNSSHSFPGK